MRRTLSVTGLAVLILAGALLAQSREQKLEEDRKVALSNGWVYDDLDEGYARARETGRPLLVVIRCPP